MNRTVPLARKSALQPGQPLRSAPMPPRSAPLRHSAGRPRESTGCITASRAEISPAAGGGKSAAARRTPATSGRRESFPPVVAALIDARDPWCVHCGSPYDLHRHHRRIKGHGGDPRPHTHCACNGVRICRSCHEWAHSGNGRREAEAEGLIIPRATTEPGSESMLVHTSEDGGGMTKWAWCDGLYHDEPARSDAA